MKGKSCYQINSCLTFQIHVGHGEMSSGSPPKTLKKIYKSVSSTFLNCCGLCKSFGDVSHWKNLFGKGNHALLAAVENIHGNPLLRIESLPHLLCRPCEKRLKNFVFKSTIIETEKSFNTEERIKRCIKVSPSTPRTLKSSKAQEERRSCRGLSFY